MAVRKNLGGLFEKVPLLFPFHNKYAQIADFSAYEV